MSIVHVQVCIFYVIKVLCTSDSAAKSHHKREKNAIEIICGFLSIFSRFIGRWPPSGPGPDSRGPLKDSLCQLASCSCYALRSKRLGHRRGKPRSLEPSMRFDTKNSPISCHPIFCMIQWWTYCAIIGGQIIITLLHLLFRLNCLIKLLIPDIRTYISEFTVFVCAHQFLCGQRLTPSKKTT